MRLDGTGITLDAQIGWGAALPVLAMLGLLVWVLLAYRRSVRGHGWVARATKALNGWLGAREMGSVTHGVVALGTVVGAIWLALLLVALIGMVWVPVTLALGEPLSEAGELRWYLLTFTALTAALGALVALPFTVLRTWLNARQTETARQSHITDQINKAVEALGAEKEVNRLGRSVVYKLPNDLFYKAWEWKDEPVELPEDAPIPRDKEPADWVNTPVTVPNREVRIGGIYALERIAQDSLRDHVQIMEILTAYIRENAKAKDLAPLVPELDPLPDDATPEARAAHVEAVTERAARIEHAARTLQADTVIQAAIQVIARRKDPQKDKEKADTRYGPEGYRLDLRGTNLRAVDISGLDLSRARLDGAHLEGALLTGAHLEASDLNAAHLEGAHLSGAHLEGAHLDGAHLEGARLILAHLERARLTGARLAGAILAKTHLEGARIAEAHLEGANFRFAIVQYAAVKSCNLLKTNLDQDQLNATFGDGSMTDAMLPRGVTRPAHWPVKDLHRISFESEWEKWKADPEGYVPP